MLCVDFLAISKTFIFSIFALAVDIHDACAYSGI